MLEKYPERRYISFLIDRFHEMPRKIMWRWAHDKAQHSVISVHGRVHQDSKNVKKWNNYKCNKSNCLQRRERGMTLSHYINGDQNNFKCRNGSNLKLDFHIPKSSIREKVKGGKMDVLNMQILLKNCHFLLIRELPEWSISMAYIVSTKCIKQWIKAWENEIQLPVNSN